MFFRLNKKVSTIQRYTCISFVSFFFPANFPVTVQLERKRCLNVTRDGFFLSIIPISYMYLDRNKTKQIWSSNVAQGNTEPNYICI